MWLSSSTQAATSATRMYASISLVFFTRTSFLACLSKLSSTSQLTCAGSKVFFTSEVLSISHAMVPPTATTASSASERMAANRLLIRQLRICEGFV